jgi:type I restriction enzyme R subunit
VEYRDADGSIRGAQARVIDFDDPANNDWLAVNQFTVVENKHNRRPDIVVLRQRPAAGGARTEERRRRERATIWSAFQQLQTYKAEMPSLFALQRAARHLRRRRGAHRHAHAGTEWFKPWRTIAGETLADRKLPELQVVIEGVFDPRRFLDLLRYFIVFEDDGGASSRRWPATTSSTPCRWRWRRRCARASAARSAWTPRDRALRGGRKPRPARRPPRRRGLAHAGLGQEPDDGVLRRAASSCEPAMENPTLVVLTDRNDLDDQLFGTFARCQDLLRQPPVQAESRAHLRELLRVASGGVVFTTIQKFFPERRATATRCSPTAATSS